MTEAAAAAAPAAAPASAPAAAPAAAAPASTTTTTTTPAAADPYASLKAPEGFDAAAMPKLAEVAKSYGLTPEAAQRLLDDTHARQVKAKQDAVAAKAKVDAENLEAIKADKDFGGEKFQASIQRAQQVIDKLEPRVPGLKARLAEIGNDAMIVRLFNIIGEGNREDTFATGGNNAAGEAEKTLAQRLYPTPN